MKGGSAISVVLVTAPGLKVARRLAALALEARLAACANLLPGVESHYWWQGKLERGKEVLVVFKTTRARLKGLERLVLTEHPYENPEFVALRIDAGAERYLAWVRESCGSPPSWGGQGSAAK